MGRIIKGWMAFKSVENVAKEKVGIEWDKILVGECSTTINVNENDYFFLLINCD